MVLHELQNIVTPKQLAEYLKVSEMTIKRALKSGALAGFKVGRDWRIEKVAVLKWLKEHNASKTT